MPLLLRFWSGIVTTIAMTSCKPNEYTSIIHSPKFLSSTDCTQSWWSFILFFQAVVSLVLYAASSTFRFQYFQISYSTRRKVRKMSIQTFDGRYEPKCVITSAWLICTWFSSLATSRLVHSCSYRPSVTKLTISTNIMLVKLIILLLSAPIRPTNAVTNRSTKFIYFKYFYIHSFLSSLLFIKCNEGSILKMFYNR